MKENKPYWISTQFVFTGSKADCDGVEKFINELPLDDRKLPRLDALVGALGCDTTTTFCRGHIDGEPLRNADDEIILDTETTGQPPYQIAHALCQRFPSLKFYFYAYLKGEDLTNDADEKFFSYKNRMVWVAIFLQNTDDSFEGEFASMTEAMNWINKVTGQNFSTEEEVDNYFDSTGDLSYCCISHVRVIGEDEQFTLMSSPDNL